MDEELIKNLILISTTIGTILGNKINLVYSSHIDFKITDISQITDAINLEQKYDTVNINQISHYKMKKRVLIFANIVEENFSREDLTNFYNNINRVKISRNNCILTLLAYGAYDIKKSNILF